MPAALDHEPLGEAPQRGRRPRNRRAITVATASRLFSLHGYDKVSMSDIAAAMNVGASAIYRHFPSKSELLIATIPWELAPYREVLLRDRDERDSDMRLLFRDLAECALDHRELGVLWQREARNLNQTQRRALWGTLVETQRMLSSRISAARPELDREEADVLAWSAFGVLVSGGFHSASLPRPRHIALLSDLLDAISRVSFDRASTAPVSGLGVDEPATQEPPTAAPPTRREAIISQATELFAQRGFAGASIDDIGDAVGIAGPSIYAHFDSKQDLLVAAVQRSTAVLLRAEADVLASGLPPADRLQALIESYVATLDADRYVVRTLIAEMDQLPPDERAATRQQEREYVERWVQLLIEVTGADPVSAYIRVQAILVVVNDAIQTPQLRSQPGFRSTISRIAASLIGAPIA